MNEHDEKNGVGGPSKASLMDRYRTWLSELERGERIRYRIIQAVSVLSLIALAVFVGLNIWISVPEVPDDPQAGQTDTGPDKPDGSGSGSAQEIVGPAIPGSGRKDGVYTFLLAGRDVVSGATDTILLLSYDTKAKTIYGLNLPRDTMVNVGTASKRLNAVYGYNRGRDKETQVEKGMTALKQETEHLTGIMPDYYVVIEWEAIGELVDALGGVEFEVPFDMNYDDPYQNLHIHQKAGLRVLDGEDAMQVVRWRKNNTGSSGGDVARLEVQQAFLKAAARKCLQPATLLRIPELVKVFQDNVSTDLTVGNILAFAQLASGMDPEKGVEFETAPLAASFSYRGAAMVTLDPEGVLEIVNEKMNPYTREIERDDLQMLYRKGDGSFGVTSGKLADEAMGRPYVPPAKPEPEEEEPQEPADPENGGGQTQEQPGEAVPAEPGTVPPIGTIDPEQIFPDPGQAAPDPGAQEGAAGGPASSLTVLPSRPEPVGDIQTIQ